MADINNKESFIILIFVDCIALDSYADILVEIKITINTIRHIF